MRMATWNVNSIRSRVDKVVEWIQRFGIDVLAMQETKCTEAQFPAEPFRAAGYQLAHHGLNQWNGVAIASRVGLADVEIGFPGMPGWGEPRRPEARAIAATCDGVRVWSLYVPNGRTLEDPHLQYKLAWLDALAQAGKGWLASDPAARVALMGDWNVAPRDEDVWDMTKFEGKTHVSPDERAAFERVVGAGYADVVRPFAPGPGVYTYWDYKLLRFARGEGMRLDFVLASPALAAQVAGAAIDRDARRGKGASDHTPVVVQLGEL